MGRERFDELNPTEQLVAKELGFWVDGLFCRQYHATTAQCGWVSGSADSRHLRMFDYAVRLRGCGVTLESFKPLCRYCMDGYRGQIFPNGRWGHDDVPETPQYGSWPHDCKAGTAFQTALNSLVLR